MKKLTGETEKFSRGRKFFIGAMATVLVAASAVSINTYSEKASAATLKSCNQAKVIKATSASDIESILKQYGIDESQLSRGKNCTTNSSTINDIVKSTSTQNCNKNQAGVKGAATKKSTKKSSGIKGATIKKSTKKSSGIKGTATKKCTTKNAVKKVIIKNCKNNSSTTKPSTTKPSTTKPSTTKPNTTKPNTTKPETNTPSTTNGNYNANYASEVLNLVNQERSKAGLSPLTMNSAATEAAKVRAKEIVNNFDHTRPNGQSPFTALDAAGVSYRAAGENIAYGQSTPSEVMNGWMNSSGHRANILNGSFKEIGIGAYYQNGRYYWVQLFIG